MPQVLSPGHAPSSPLHQQMKCFASAKRQELKTQVSKEEAGGTAWAVSTAST